MNITKELAKLEKMSVGELREQFAEVCGETTLGRNKTCLIRRIAWRLQANAEGGLSERALAWARELANDADIRVTPPRAKPAHATPHAPTRATTLAKTGDDRLPLPGTVIERQYKGRSGCCPSTIACPTMSRSIPAWPRFGRLFPSSPMGPS